MRVIARFIGSLIERRLRLLHANMPRHRGITQAVVRQVYFPKPRVGGSLQTGTDTMYWPIKWASTPNGNIAVPVKAPDRSA